MQISSWKHRKKPALSDKISFFKLTVIYNPHLGNFFGKGFGIIHNW